MGGSDTTAKVLLDAKGLAGGTMAVLIRSLAVPGVQPGHYEVIGRVQAVFVAHVIGAGAGAYRTWQEAWDDFARAPAATLAAREGLVRANGVTVQYELHRWDAPR